MYAMYTVRYSTHNHNMILFKLLIKLYATVLLLNTRTRCSENEYKYLPYCMYSSTSLQSLIYKILFLGGTNFTDVISSTNTLSIGINSSSILNPCLYMGIFVWDDAFNSSSTVNYYKYRFVDTSSTLSMGIIVRDDAFINSSSTTSTVLWIQLCTVQIQELKMR